MDLSHPFSHTLDPMNLLNITPPPAVARNSKSSQAGGEMVKGSGIGLMLKRRNAQLKDRRSTMGPWHVMILAGV